MAIALEHIPEKQQSTVQLDPQGEVDYPCDWPLLLTRHSATLSSVVTTLTAEAVAAGLEIIAEAHDTTRSVIRFGIVTGSESDAAFDPPNGVWCRFKQVATLSTGEIVARSFALQVVKK